MVKLGMQCYRYMVLVLAVLEAVIVTMAEDLVSLLALLLTEYLHFQNIYFHKRIESGKV